MPITRPTLTKLAERGVRDQSSPVTNFGDNASDETRKFFVKWGERFDAAFAICGGSRIASDGSGNPTRLERLTPMKHPTLAGWYATAVTDIRGFKVRPSTQDSPDAGGGWANRWDLADITVKYEPLRWKVEEDSSENLTQEFRRNFYLAGMNPSAEVVRGPIGSLRFKAPTTSDVDGLMVPYGVTTIQPTIDIEWIWENVPADALDIGSPLGNRIYGKPDYSELSYIGCINKAAWPGSSGFAPGSLLLTEYRPVPKVNKLGILSLDIHMRTLFRATKGGWNALWHSDPAGVLTGYYFVTRSSGTPTYYAPGSVPDNASLYNERLFSHLTLVQAAA